MFFFAVVKRKSVGGEIMSNHALLSFPDLISSREKSEMKVATNIIEAIENIPSSEDIKEVDYIVRLHKLGRLLCTLTEGHSEFLCQEVKAITQGRACLHLGAQV